MFFRMCDNDCFVVVFEAILNLCHKNYMEDGEETNLRVWPPFPFDQNREYINILSILSKQTGTNFLIISLHIYSKVFSTEDKLNNVASLMIREAGQWQNIHKLLYGQRQSATIYMVPEIKYKFAILWRCNN